MQHESLLKVSRLENLTDGVFAIAMTLLVFGIHLPDGTDSNSLPSVLTSNILEMIFIYAGSFIILATQWIAINFQHGFLDRINRPYLWVNIFYLMSAGLVPFSASLLIDYPSSHISLSFFVTNLVFSYILQLTVWHYGNVYKLYNASYTTCVRKVVIFRLSMPPLFYFSALIIAHWNATIAFALLIVTPMLHLIPGKLDRYIARIESET